MAAQPNTNKSQTLAHNTSAITDSSKPNNNMNVSQELSINSGLKLGQDLQALQRKFRQVVNKLELQPEKQAKLLAFEETLFRNLGHETALLEERIDELNSQLVTQRNKDRAGDKDATELLRIIEKKDFELADLRIELQTFRLKLSEREGQILHSKVGVEAQLADVKKALAFETQKSEMLVGKFTELQRRAEDLQKINYDLKTALDSREKYVKEAEGRLERERQMMAVTLESQVAGLKRELQGYQSSAQRNEENYRQRVAEVLMQNESLQRECQNYRATIKTLEEERLKFELMDNANRFDVDSSMIGVGIGASISLLGQRRDNFGQDEDEIHVPSSPNNSFEAPKLTDTTLAPPVVSHQDRSPVEKSFMRQRTNNLDGGPRANTKQYLDKIEELEAQVAALKTNINSLQEHKFGLEGQMNQLNSKIGKLDSEKSSLLANFDAMVNKNIKLEQQISEMTNGNELEHLKKLNVDLVEQVEFYRKINQNLERTIAELNSRIKALEEGQTDVMARPFLAPQEDFQQFGPQRPAVKTENQISGQNPQVKAESVEKYQAKSSIDPDFDFLGIVSKEAQQIQPQVIDSGVILNDTPKQQATTDPLFSNVRPDQPLSQGQGNYPPHSFNSMQMLFNPNTPNLNPGTFVAPLKPNQDADVTYHELENRLPHLTNQTERKPNFEQGQAFGFSIDAQNVTTQRANPAFLTPDMQMNKTASDARKPSLSEFKFNEFNAQQSRQQNPDKPGTENQKKKTDFNNFNFNMVQQTNPSTTPFDNSNNEAFLRKMASGENSWGAPKLPGQPQLVASKTSEVQPRPNSNPFAQNTFEGGQQTAPVSQPSPVFSAPMVPQVPILASTSGHARDFANWNFPGQTPANNSSVNLQAEAQGFGQQSALSSSRNLQSQNALSQLKSAKSIDKFENTIQNNPYDLSIFDNPQQFPNQQPTGDLNSMKRSNEGNTSTSKFRDFDFAKVNVQPPNLVTPQKDSLGQGRPAFGVSWPSQMQFNQTPENPMFGSQHEGNSESKIKQLEESYQVLLNDKRKSEFKNLELQRQINNLKFDQAMNKPDQKEDQQKPEDPVVKSKSDFSNQEKQVFQTKNPFETQQKSGRKLPNAQELGQQTAQANPPTTNRSNRGSLLVQADKLLPPEAKTNQYFSDVLKKQAPKLRNIIDVIKLQKEPEQQQNTKRYSYDHLDVSGHHTHRNIALLKIIQNEQSLDGKQNWYSEHANRFNSWKKKTQKMIVVTNSTFFIFNIDKTLKRFFQLTEIRRISHDRQYNYLCFKLATGNDEMLEFINKEELLMFLEQQLKKVGKELPMSVTESLSYTTTVQERVQFNPMDIKKYRPQWVKTFNYAAKHTCIGYANIRVSQLLGLIDQSKAVVLLLTNMAIICFSVLEFNVVEVLPLIGSHTAQPHNSRYLQFLMSDNSPRTIEFNSQLDRNLWVQAINSSIAQIKE